MERRKGRGRVIPRVEDLQVVRISGETGYPRVKKFLKYEIARRKNFV